MSQSVTIKSNKYGINLVLDPEIGFDELLKDVVEKFKASSTFFKNAKLALSFEGRKLSEEEEQQIIKRDNHSWFIDGSTPIEDVKHALAIEEFPENENYETIAGFIMYRLRKIPRPADAVEYAGFKFEVVDIDHYKIDQLLVTQIMPNLETESPTQEN